MAVNLLVLDDQGINAMMVDPRITAILPCLVNTKANLDMIKPGKPGCSVCAGKRASVQTQAYNDAKACIARLRGAPLLQLKELLNAKQLRLHVNRVMYTL